MILAALNIDGLNLKYVDISETTTLKSYEINEVIKTALNNNAMAFDSIPSYFRNREIIKYALKRNGNVLQYIHQDKKDDEELVKIAITQTPDALQINPLILELDFVKELLSN